MESFHKHNPQNHERKIENSGFRPRRFYTLGPTQYSSLWNFFIDKSSVCDRSWKSSSYFLYDLQGRSKIKRKIQVIKQTMLFFRSALRFAVPQFSPGTGLLNQKRNPHEITSVIPSITILLSGLHGFLKAAYQSKRSLILIRDTSKFLPNSSSVFWFRSFRSEPAYWIRSRTLILLPLS